MCILLGLSLIYVCNDTTVPRAAGICAQQCQLLDVTAVATEQHSSVVERLYLLAELCSSLTPVSVRSDDALLDRTPPPAMMLMRPAACLTSSARMVPPCKSQSRPWSGRVAHVHRALSCEGSSTATVSTAVCTCCPSRQPSRLCLSVVDIKLASTNVKHKPPGQARRLHQ